MPMDQRTPPLRSDGFELEGDAFDKGPWVGDNYWVSHFNYDREVLSRLHFPDEVVFHDVTLRDGEQTPGVVFRKDEKVEIARRLDEVGVQRIEAGMPVVSQEDFEAVREIAHLGLSAKVIAFSRMLREDVDAALRADVSGVITEAPVGIPKLRQFGWSYDQVIEKSIDVVSYAKAHGLWVALFGVDSTRADPEFLIRLFREVDAAAHHDSVVLADTFGCTSPEAYGKFVSVIRRSIPQTIEVHTHNDFGLAVATAISGLANGASVVHTSVNGLGERAGNASFEEVALALKLLYGARVRVKFERLKELSELVQRYSGVRLAPNKPVVGDRVFTREAGISIAGWIKYHLGSEAYLPEVVGNRHGVLLGKKSGSHTIEWKLGELGISATKEQVDEILRLVKRRAEEKKSNVTDEEFVEIVKSVINK